MCSAVCSAAISQLEQEEQRLLENADRVAVVHDNLDQSGSESEALMSSVDKTLASLQALHSAFRLYNRCSASDAPVTPESMTTFETELLDELASKPPRSNAAREQMYVTLPQRESALKLIFAGMPWRAI